MSVFRRGSLGAEVRQIQTRLQALHLYPGAVDGQYGGGTEAAVRAFQRIRRLPVDGTVGPRTWEAVMGRGADPPDTDPAAQSIGKRCLSMTSAFETDVPAPECFCRVAGDFDHQGISFGALQFNLGRETLQPIRQALLDTAPAVMTAIFGGHLPTLRAVLAQPVGEQLVWARSIQTPRLQLIEPWRGMLMALGRTPECQAIQMRDVERRVARARTMCRRYDLTSERGLALMFDIAVQNGSIGPVAGPRIARDLAALPSGGSWAEREVARMRIIANRRAEAADPRWVEDVRQRKLAIANGDGVVHGNHYDLAEQFGVRLVPADGTPMPDAAPGGG